MPFECGEVDCASPSSLEHTAVGQLRALKVRNHLSGLAQPAGGPSRDSLSIQVANPTLKYDPAFPAK
jgi:hypothetical protein